MKVESVIAPGIYRMDNGSFRVVARVGDRKTGPRPREKRFPAGTASRVMRRWQDDQRAELRRLNIRPVKGTLSDDIDRYLREVNNSVKFISIIVTNHIRNSFSNLNFIKFGYRWCTIEENNSLNQPFGMLHFIHCLFSDCEV